MSIVDCHPSSTQHKRHGDSSSIQHSIPSSSIPRTTHSFCSLPRTSLVCQTFSACYPSSGRRDQRSFARALNVQPGICINWIVSRLPTAETSDFPTQDTGLPPLAFEPLKAIKSYTDQRLNQPRPSCSSALIVPRRFGEARGATACQP